MSIAMAVNSYSQVNLVPNPSFEVYDTCPNNAGQIYYSVPWFQPTMGTSDYLNSCIATPLGVPLNFYGYQPAHTGGAYAGFFACILMYDSFPFPNYREYAEVKLNASLQSGVKYFVSFYVSLADSVNYATDAIGVCFSTDTIKNDTGYFLAMTPQIENSAGDFIIDKSGWTKISKSYVASGGEQFLTIGNFKNHAATNTISVAGGSANTGQSDWSGGYYYLDDVCVSTDSIYAESWTGVESQTINEKINIYPNPATDFLIVENLNNSRYSIINSFGQQITAGTLYRDTEKIDVSLIPAGIYFFTSDGNHFYKIVISH
jgi:hypothetical protein